MSLKSAFSSGRILPEQNLLGLCIWQKYAKVNIEHFVFSCPGLSFVKTLFTPPNLRNRRSQPPSALRRETSAGPATRSAAWRWSLARGSGGSHPGLTERLLREPSKRIPKSQLHVVSFPSLEVHLRETGATVAIDRVLKFSLASMTWRNEKKKNSSFESSTFPS